MVAPQGIGVYGPVPGEDAIEVVIPYKANKDEFEIDWPNGDIREWLSQYVDLNAEDTEVSWMVARRMDQFWFYFRDPQLAMLFKLTWAV